MGQFFTNLHVQVGAEGLGGVQAALDVDAKRQGMDPIAEGEVADRRVILVPGARWLSVYDEATEGQDPQELDRLGEALSKASGAPAFSVLVHDSDVLRLARYGHGTRVDIWHSKPGDFGPPARRDPTELHVAAWRDLCPGDEEPLSAVFGSDPLFAEAVLPALAEALGVDGGRLDAGQRTLADGSWGGLPAGAVVLGWRARSRPGWALPASGPPRLETQWEQAARRWGHHRPASPPQIHDIALGGELRLGITTMNAGGPGTGLTVEITAGDITSWATAQAVLGNPQAATWLERPLLQEGDRWVARFPGAPLPAGQADPTAAVGASQALRAMEARSATQVHVNLIGRAEQVGRADVAVRVWPGQGTGTSETLAVEVKSTEARPLRAPADLHPSMLSPLEDRSRLVALVALEPTALPRAADVVTAVAAALPAQGKVRATRYPGPLGSSGGQDGLASALAGASAPKVSTGRAAGFLSGKRWKNLLAAAVEGSTIEAEWVADSGATHCEADLSLGPGLLPPPDAVPTLALGVHGGEDCEERLVEAIDGLARDGLLLQAFVTRWGQSPRGHATIYELACGVHGQCTTQRAWATRWLRGLGPGWLWLGSELAARVDPASVRGVPVGPALKVVVGDVAATEHALADLLPGASDWQEGMTRRYQP